VEETKLTIRDLGGEEKTSYSVSSNVTDAMSAFLAEERTVAEIDKDKKAEATKSTWFGKQHKADAASAPRNAETDMEELDAYHRDLAAAVMGDAIQADAERKAQRDAEPVLQRKVITWVSIVAGIVLFYAVAAYTYTQVRNYIIERNRPPEIQDTNRALDILAQEQNKGEIPIRALTEACRAYGVKPVEENMAILENVEALFIKEVEALLDANPWTRNRLNEASTYITQAAAVDSARSIQDLYLTVQNEVKSYSMLLVKIQENSQTGEIEATFDLDGTQVTGTMRPGNAGEHKNMLAKRFIITKISMYELSEVSNAQGSTGHAISKGYVLLKDLTRKNRKLKIKEGLPLEPGG
jgi:hypothetical protein